VNAILDRCARRFVLQLRHDGHLLPAIVDRRQPDFEHGRRRGQLIGRGLAIGRGWSEPQTTSHGTTKFPAAGVRPPTAVQRPEWSNPWAASVFTYRAYCPSHSCLADTAADPAPAAVSHVRREIVFA
jgi:hypothetical protein